MYIIIGSICPFTAAFDTLIILLVLLLYSKSDLISRIRSPKLIILDKLCFVVSLLCNFITIPDQPDKYVITTVFITLIQVLLTVGFELDEPELPDSKLLSKSDELDNSN